ncbi:MAG: 23S rRNA (uracil(1939)-C(5))-methyltransferase RlmD [[Clostridium] aminophilum]|uniref:23S rRNA (uracil(1939)-C(5))-methyltransferase RlmD n=1 Tax=[Clostridium] aminophilum TaxID=1526 RepID=UPI0026ECF755|nr:23S rRNA (uracil(1939)-C(5))-methyltransferase RlmD [[Clostridium] aminophilum]MDD6195816.1 23S rRNA (uracil(1939)-C(5))-methyltransferase RlmD [[Clostridium] aminophilum]
MEKNEEFNLTIEDMGKDGAGIGRKNDFVWFVKDAVVGDVITAKVMKVQKNYGFARLMKIITPSKYRTEAPCPVAKQCGGCQLQMMDYHAQLRVKENEVRNALIRIGGIPEEELNMKPILGMEESWRYRNKAQYPIGRDKDGRIIAGFYAARSHRIVECEDCLLGVKENKKILNLILGFMEDYHIRPYDEAAHKGLVRHVLIRKGFKTGEIMVCLVVNGTSLPHSEELVRQLLLIPGMTSVSLSVNTRTDNVIMGAEIINLYGDGCITDYIGEIRYRISPMSFFQVNPVQTEKLYGTALSYANLKGKETVWDLYCGIGTISLFLAQKAGKVCGVEIIPDAIRDAKENAALNGIGNADFFVGKAEDVLPEKYEKENISADVIVVDPPRKGCDQAVLDTMLKMKPKTVVYVSCNPSTLARDVKILTEGGYRLRKVRCCDMFPMSMHVETVAQLVRADA